jgi:Concanavalin A-like lectin/glucanases superfamily/Divergent InlB B-repeat domain
LQITGNLTIEAWVKPTDFTNYNGIVGKTLANIPAPYDFYLRSGSGLPALFLGNGSVFSWSTANAAPPAGSWSHIAVTMNGATATHYLNSLPNGSGTVSTTIADGGRNARIGSRDDLFTMFKGALDEIRVSNTARSADWIATEYNNQNAPLTFYTLACESGSCGVSITVNTVPPGLAITLDGQNYTAPQTFQWTAGSSHPIAVNSTQDGTTGTRYVFSNWSDVGANPHNVVASSSTPAYTAYFTMQYQLTTTATAGGSISPASGGWYNSGSLVSVSAAANAGYTFGGFSGGALSGPATPQNLTLNGPATVTANFSAVTEGITVNTSPPGLTITVDGQSCAPAPCSYQWITGSIHTLVMPSAPQPGGSGTQFVFANWSDGGGASHSITVSAAAASYTATFTTQYQLTTAGSPNAGGTITPATGSFYNSGTIVILTATANSGYYFAGFTGAATGATPQNLTITGPVTVTANFAASNPVTVNTAPAGLSLTLDGQVCAAAPCTYQLVPGTSHTLAVAGSPQNGSTGTQYTFTNWSDGLALSHSITVPTTPPQPYIATFTTQYYLTVSGDPGAGGTTTPMSGWHSSGDVVPVSATPSSGYSFGGFTGALTVATPSAALTMTGPAAVTANFSAASVPVTVTSSPGGLQLSVDGQPCTAPCVYQWLLGSSHTLGVGNTTQDGLNGARYLFTGWSDGTTITVPTTAKAYTATFKTQYYLTTNVSPNGTGTLVPASDWYDSGSVVQLTAESTYPPGTSHSRVLGSARGYFRRDSGGSG